VLPKNVGRYEVLGKLATGGMAEILLARLSGPADFVRAVVIKRILSQYASNESFVAMFLDEARIVAKIRHPNVVQVQELGQDEGGVFLVLEYVAGENLSSVLKRATAVGEKLEAALVAHVVAEACAGLHAAHELVTDDGRSENLVHRDVSPQNLFVAYDGHVKLLDFGVARTNERIARTAVGDVKGKFEYMSPEQVNGGALDRRSDIFAMGIVLYELATGRRLFKRASHARTLEAVVKEPIVPPSRLVDGVPPSLEAVCMRALAKRPEDRYATAAEMRIDLLEIARSLPSPTEAIADRMHRWFPERIAEKDEMLTRLRHGDEIARVPPGEVEENVRIPSVPEARSPDDTGGEIEPTTAGAAARRTTRGVVIGASVAVAITIVGAATAVGWARRGPPRPTREPAPALGAAELSSSTSLPPSAEVLVQIESRPGGAHVYLNGEDRGATPVALRLARGGAPVMLEVRRAGYLTTLQAVIPDNDQKILLALQPAAAPVAPHAAGKAPPRNRGAPPPAAPQGSGFRRFD